MLFCPCVRTQGLWLRPSAHASHPSCTGACSMILSCFALLLYSLRCCAGSWLHQRSCHCSCVSRGHKGLSLQLRIPRAQGPVTAVAYPKGTRACHCNCVSQAHNSYRCLLISLFPHNEGRRGFLILLFAHIAVSS